MIKRTFFLSGLTVIVGLFLFVSCWNIPFLEEEVIGRPETPRITEVIPGDGKVTLKWTGPTGGDLERASEYVRQYRIYYSKNNIDIATDKYVETDVHSGVRKITITGLDNGDSYTFAVAAINYGGAGDVSASKVATPRLGDIAALEPLVYAPLILSGPYESPPNWGTSTPDVDYKPLNFWPKELTLRSDGVVILDPSAGVAVTGKYLIEAIGRVRNTGIRVASIEVLANPLELGAVPGFSLDFPDKAVTALTATTYSGTINGARLIPGTDYDLSLTLTSSSGRQLGIANDGTITIPELNTTDVGTYTVKATGKGRYVGFVEDDFSLRVVPKILNSLSGLTLGYPANPSVNFGNLISTTLSPSPNHSLTPGTDLTFSIRSRPQQSDPAAVTIHSDTGVITIDSAVVAADAGDYTVEAIGNGNYTGSERASFSLTVNSVSIALKEGSDAAAPSAGPTINKNSGDTFSLYADVTTPGVGIGSDVTWSSTDTSVAEVTLTSGNTKLVTVNVKKPGSATIEARSVEDTSVVSSVVISVDRKFVAGAVLTYPGIVMTEGATTGNTSSPTVTGLLVGQDALADAVEFTIGQNKFRRSRAGSGDGDNHRFSNGNNNSSGDADSFWSNGL